MHIGYRAALFIADRATVDRHTGGLNLLNAGWSVTAPAPGQGIVFSLGAIVDVPWDRCNISIPITLTLMTDDRSAVLDAQGRPITISQAIKVNARPGAPSGAGGVGTMLVEFPAPGLVLEPRNHYHWVASIDGQTNDQWQVTFWVDGPHE